MTDQTYTPKIVEIPGKRIIITDGRGQQVGLPLVVQEEI